MLAEARQHLGAKWFVRGYNKMQFQRDEEENFEEKRSRLSRVFLNSGEKHASKIYILV